MKVPRIRLSETIILVVYAALIGNALVTSFVTPDSPAPVQVSPSTSVIILNRAPPGVLAEFVTVDIDGSIWFTNRDPSAIVFDPNRASPEQLAELITVDAEGNIWIANKEAQGK